MYEAKFYTPDDYIVPSTEEHLEIFWGEFGRYIEPSSKTYSLGSMRSLLLELSLQTELPQSESHAQEILRNVPSSGLAEQRYKLFEMVERSQWLESVTNAFNGLVEVPNIDFSFVKKAWRSSDVLDEIWVGTADKKWIVVHWYSTA